jgi:predicted Zn-dependent protease
MKAGRVDDARKQADALIAAAPDDSVSYDIAGDVLVEAAPLDAARHYLKAVKLAPANVDFLVKLGSALVRAGEYEASLQSLALAVEKAPDRREAHAGLAAAFYGTHRYELAAREFGWLAAREPDSAFVQFFLGASLDRIGDCAGALAAFERFLAKADPQRDKGRIDEVNLVVPRLRRQVDKGDCVKKSKKGE